MTTKLRAAKVVLPGINDLTRFEKCPHCHKEIKIIVGVRIKAAADDNKRQDFRRKP